MGLVSKTYAGLCSRAGGLAFPLLVLGVALLFNELRPLWAPDEGRYVAGALEMLRRHDFVGIFLNDDTAHFTKPPLAYWTLAAAIAAFGPSEFVVRLPNAVAFAVTAWLLLPAGRLLLPRMPMLPAVVYATMWLPFLGAHFVTTDTLVALFTTLAGVSFLHLQAGIAPRRAALGVWLGFGLAFLTKGPPTLLALPVFAGWLAYRRDRAALRHLFVSAGVPLFAAVAFGWFLLADARFPGLLRYLLSAEVGSRVASQAFERNGDWYDAIVIYLPTLAVGTLPWLPAWLLLRRSRPFAPAHAAPVDRLLLLWMALPLGVLLVAPSRLPLYLLPLCAPLALWLARRFEPALPGIGRARAGIALAAAIVLLVALKLGLAAVSPADRDGRAAAQAIARLAPGPLDDVVFVDQRALWELRFYLGVQVRQAWARRRPYEPTYRPAPTLEELLAQPDAGRARVFVVHPLSTPAFERALRAAGLCPERLGREAAAIVYRAPTTAAAGCASRAALVQGGTGHDS